MANLADDDKIRVLEVRAQRDSRGKPTAWELVAEKTGHSKLTVLEVNRWFQALPWDAVRMFPLEIRRLRQDYIVNMEAGFTSEGVQVFTTKVGPVPDAPTKYAHPLGVNPTSVQVTPTSHGTLAPIYVGRVTDQYIELRSQTNCSGVIGLINIQYNPRLGSVAWLKPLTQSEPPSTGSLGRGGTSSQDRP